MERNHIRPGAAKLLHLLSARSNCFGAMPNRTGVRNPPTRKGEGHIHSPLAFTQLPFNPQYFCSGVAGGRTEMCRSGASCGAAESGQRLSMPCRAALLQLYHCCPTARDELSSRRRATRTGYVGASHGVAARRRAPTRTGQIADARHASAQQRAIQVWIRTIHTVH